MTRETLAALGLVAIVLTLGVLLANYRISVVVNAMTGADLHQNQRRNFQ